MCDRAQADVWTAVLRVVWQKDLAIMDKIFHLRDAMRNESDATRAVCAVESFGSIEQPVSAFALGLAADYPALERLDEKVIPQPQTWPST